jgi:chromosomal replication initiation ATPase DnaA
VGDSWEGVTGKEIGVRIKGGERIPGCSDFVERVLEKADAQLEEKYRLQITAVSLQTLIDNVAQCFKIDPEDLASASKERYITRARRALCYIAVRKLGYKCSDVSKTSGVSASTVSKAVSLGSKLPETATIQKRIPGDQSKVNGRQSKLGEI